MSCASAAVPAATNGRARISERSRPDIDLPLVRAPRRQNHRHRAEQDLDVEAERPSIDVSEIQTHPVLEVHAVAAGDLPEAGDSRLHGEAPALPALVLLDLLRDRRARPDEAHVALEHVPELRQLVDGEAPDPPADR